MGPGNPHEGSTNFGTFTTDDLAEGSTNLYSQWERESGFLRPKTTTDDLYIGDATTANQPFGGELAVYEKTGDTAFNSLVAHAAASIFNAVLTEGTSDSPSATTNAEGRLAAYAFSGYGTSSYVANFLPGLYMTPTGTWTDTTEPNTLSLGDSVTGNVYEITLGSGTASDGDSFIRTTGGQILHSDFSANRLYFGDADEAYVDNNGIFYAPVGSASAPGYTFNGFSNDGIYSPADNQVGVTANGVAQMIVTSGGNTVELLPSNRTFTTTQVVLNIDDTYTLDYASATMPLALNFGGTSIFNQNGGPFGSGVGFYFHPVMQNNSGSTRTMGPFITMAHQPNYQANGGSFTVGYDIPFATQTTLSRINSGTLAATASSSFWSQGVNVGTGTTLSALRHYYVSYAATVTGTLTDNIGIDIESFTQGTNRYAAIFDTPSSTSATIWRTLWLSANADNTTENGGIIFGSSADTNLYRSAANTLKTDDKFHTASEIEIDGALNHDGTTVGFFGTTPTTQQTELTDELTTITFTSPGTPDYAIQNLTNAGGYGFVTQDEGNTVLSVIANLQTRVNELETKLTAYGLLVDAD